MMKNIKLVIAYDGTNYHGWQVQKDKRTIQGTIELQLKKITGGLAEKAKVSIRNIRREANDNLKKELKDKKISEDESKNLEKKIQKLTDDQVAGLEKKLDTKEKEIMTV